MSDWKQVPAISANAFAVAALGNGMLRVAFGERLDQAEPAFYGAMLVDQEAARLLIGYLQQALAQLQGGGGSGGVGESGKGEGGPRVILGSTSIH